MEFMLLMIGTTELILVAAVALLFFGGKKLPEMMKGLGQGVRNFKDGMNEPSEKRRESGEEPARKSMECGQDKEIAEKPEGDNGQ